jgi:hypothetical protein
MLIGTSFLLLGRGTRAQSLSAPYTYTPNMTSLQCTFGSILGFLLSMGFKKSGFILTFYREVVTKRTVYFNAK